MPDYFQIASILWYTEIKSFASNRAPFRLGAFDCRKTTKEAMPKNCSIQEYEGNITMRLLLDRAPREEFTYSELLRSSKFVANDILKELGLSDELWVRMRGARAFIFHNRTNTLVAELVVDSEPAPNSDLRRRPRVLLLGKNSYVRAKTMADLIVYAQRVQDYRKSNRMNTNFKKGTK